MVSCSFSFISCSGCFDDPPFPLSPRSGIITVSGRRGLSGRWREQVVSGGSTRTAARERNFRRRNNGGLESNLTKKMHVTISWRGASDDSSSSQNL